MDLDSIKIGKINNYQNGVGEIITTDDSYLFTINDVSDENLKNGDLVKFRAEKVQDNNKAFFVNKIDENYQIQSTVIKSKVYKNNN